jgi:hypothetical protein
LAEYEAWVKNVDDLGARSVRGNEWIELFESDESWGNLKRLSRAVDVSVVLAA